MTSGGCGIVLKHLLMNKTTELLQKDLHQWSDIASWINYDRILAILIAFKANFGKIFFFRLMTS